MVSYILLIIIKIFYFSKYIINTKHLLTVFFND
nr:MAG TPA: hypothetical protein [Caudoviricetes sp.]